MVLDDEEEGLIQLCATGIMSEWHNVWSVSWPSKDEACDSFS